MYAVVDASKPPFTSNSKDTTRISLRYVASRSSIRFGVGNDITRLTSCQMIRVDVTSLYRAATCSIQHAGHSRDHLAKPLNIQTSKLLKWRWSCQAITHTMMSTRHI